MSRTTRTVIGSILLVIAGFTAVAGLGAFWTQHKILDEQTWVATSKALVNDPTVQREVAQIVANEIIDVVGVENFVASTLPPPFNALSGTVRDRAADLLTLATEQIVATDAFVSIWETAVRATHNEFVRIVDGTSPFTQVDSSGLSLNVTAALEMILAKAQSLGLPTGSINLSNTNLSVQLIDAPGLSSIRDWVHISRLGAIIFPAIALVAGLGGILIAAQRSVAVAYSGGAGLVAVIIYLAISGTLKNRITNQIAGGVISEGTARIVVDEVASSMNFVMVIAAIVSAAVLIGGIIGYVTIGRPNRAKVTV